MHSRPSWEETMKSGYLVTYSVDSKDIINNQMRFGMVKIEKIPSTPGKFHCTIVLAEFKADEFLNELQKQLGGRTTEIRRINLYGTFYLQFDNKDADTIKAALAVVDTFHSFDGNTRETLCHFIGVDAENLHTIIPYNRCRIL